MKKLTIAVVLASVLVLSISLIAQAVFYSFPTRVVAKQSFLNQTTNLPETVIYTSSAEGDYRVSVYLATPPNIGGIAGTLYWSDTMNSYNPNFGAVPANSNSASESTFILHIAAGSSISVSTFNYIESTYNMYVTVEQLFVPPNAVP
jgi:hypothetical protein